MTPRHIPEGGLVGNVLLYTGLALVATGLVITAVGLELLLAPLQIRQTAPLSLVQRPPGCALIG